MTEAGLDDAMLGGDLDRLAVESHAHRPERLRSKHRISGSVEIPLTMRTTGRAAARRRGIPAGRRGRRRSPPSRRSASAQPSHRSPKESHPGWKRERSVWAS